MPSQFESEMAGQLSDFDASFGVAATYIAVDGSAPVPCTIRLRRQETREIPSSGNKRIKEFSQTGQAILQAAAFKPVPGARFTVDGVEVWTITTKPHLINGSWICTVGRQGKERMMGRQESRE